MVAEDEPFGIAEFTIDKTICSVRELYAGCHVFKNVYTCLALSVEAFCFSQFAHL